MVVAVRLIGLEHRELGVVFPIDALVPEVPPELVDALQPPDEHPLEVELERDPELQIDVEGAVVGREGACVGASGDRLEDRPLELHEPSIVEHSTHRPERRGPRKDVSPGRVVGDEVKVPAPLLQVRVLEAVPFLGKRPKRLREHRPALHEDAQLARPRRAEVPVHADDVAQVDLVELREPVLGQARLREHELEIAVAIADGHELQLAEVALEHHAPGHDESLRRRRVGREIGVGLADHAGRRRFVDIEDRVEVDRERPLPSQAFERRAPGREHLGLAPGGPRFLDR